jgi:hypothetical protein
MLARHPVFAPRAYTGMSVVVGADGVRLAFSAGSAADDDSATWLCGLGGPVDSALDALAVAYHPQARCDPVQAHPGERFAYRAGIDPTAPPRREPADLAIARISTGAAFEFRGGRAALPLAVR